MFGIANFSYAGTRAARFRRAGGGDPRRISAIAGRHRSACQRARADKRFPFTSPQIEREVGGLIKEATGWHVDLERPGADDAHRDAARPRVLLFRQGAGRRRPADGTGGRVACLLSGGIDSPVAAYRLMRRGCARAARSISTAIRSCRARRRRKSREIARAADALPAAVAAAARAVRRAAAAGAPRGRPELRVVIYRRLMLRIAERLARALARAGRWSPARSIGQVASQTLENMTTIAEATTHRNPASAGRDGQGRDYGRGQPLGTYPISIIPDQDCCTLFTPKHPATRARKADIDEAERLLRSRRWSRQREPAPL